MKRPLLVVAVGYIIGIVWGLYCKCSIALLYGIIISGYLLFKLICKSKNKFKLISFKRYFRYLKLIFKFNVIIAIIISSLISNMILINQNKKYNTLYSNVNYVTIIGVIASNSKQKEYKDVYKIKVETINGMDRFKNTYLLLNVKNNINTKLEYGNKVEIEGTFIHPEEQRNYKGFDYKEFLKTQRVYGTVKVSKAKILDKNCLNSIFLVSNRAFLQIKEKIENTFPEATSGLTLGIMLGYTDELDENIKQSFRESNIAHVLAVSGMHISYIVLGLMIVLKHTLRKKKKQNNNYISISCIHVYNGLFTVCSKSRLNGNNNVRFWNLI